MNKRGFESVIDIEKFLNDCESCCFDCGADGKHTKLIQMHRGVAICPVCLKGAFENFPLETAIPSIKKGT